MAGRCSDRWNSASYWQVSDPLLERFDVLAKPGSPLAARLDGIAAAVRERPDSYQRHAPTGNGIGPNRSAYNSDGIGKPLPSVIGPKRNLCGLP
jgi:hypothetical protein